MVEVAGWPKRRSGSSPLSARHAAKVRRADLSDAGRIPPGADSAGGACSRSAWRRRQRRAGCTSSREPMRRATVLRLRTTRRAVDARSRRDVDVRWRAAVQPARYFAMDSIRRSKPGSSRTSCAGRNPLTDVRNIGAFRPSSRWAVVRRDRSQAADCTSDAIRRGLARCSCCCRRSRGTFDCQRRLRIHAGVGGTAWRSCRVYAVDRDVRVERRNITAVTGDLGPLELPGLGDAKVDRILRKFAAPRPRCRMVSRDLRRW